MSQESVKNELQEMWGDDLRRAIELRFPGLADYVEASIDSLYGALSFALQFEATIEQPAAATMWLRRAWSERHGELKTYDRHLSDFAQLIDFASHDAWLSERLARDGIDVGELKACDRCGDIMWLGCKCHRRGYDR